MLTRTKYSGKAPLVVGAAVVAAVLMVLPLLAGCKAEVESCGHSYDNDCDTTCNQCGSQRPASHKWAAATCGKPRTCSVCGAADGNALGHTPETDDGDCTTPVPCSVCGGEAVAARGSHTGGTATCVKGKLCEACGHEYGDPDPAAHSWGGPTYRLRLGQDKTQCTATVRCGHDGSHQVTETKGATPNAGESGVYTVQFENPLFPLTEYDNRGQLGGVTAGSWGGANQGETETFTGDFTLELWNNAGSTFHETYFMTHDGTGWNTFNRNILPATVLAYCGNTVNVTSFDNYSVELTEDQSTEEAFNAADVMIATGTVDWGGELSLNFEHHYAKVTFKVTPGGEFEGTDTISNLYVVTKDSSCPEVTAYNSATGEYSAYVTAGTYRDGDNFVKIDIGGEQVVAKMQGEATLAAGTQYAFNLTVGKDAVDISSVSP